MKILGEKNGELLIGKLTTASINDGIYIERDENEVPKKVIEATKKLGGYGVQYEKWFRSNTHGITAGKYFELISNRIQFDIKKHEAIQQLNYITDINKGITLLENALERDNLMFIFDCCKNKEIECTFKLCVDKDDYIALEHEFQNDENYNDYKNYFSGRDKAEIYLNINIDLKEYDKFIEEIKGKKRKYNKNDIYELLHGRLISKVEWYFNMSEDKYFYGNDDFK